MFSGPKINWKAAEEELDFRIQFLSNILPPELAQVKNMIEARAKLPKKLKFCEPTTPKLRKDINVLYKSYLQLWDKLIAVLDKRVHWVYTVIKDA